MNTSEIFLIMAILFFGIGSLAIVIPYTLGISQQYVMESHEIVAFEMIFFSLFLFFISKSGRSKNENETNNN